VFFVWACLRLLARTSIKFLLVVHYSAESRNLLFRLSNQTQHIEKFLYYAVSLTQQQPGLIQKSKQKKKVKNQSNTKPAHKIRHGVISASIWRQETDKGALFNVTFQRAYKDGDAWKNSASFGRNNLLVLSLIAARAFEWIGNQETNLRRNSPLNPD
jgi:hypothetical protein